MIKVIVQKGKNRRTVYTVPSWDQVWKFLRWGKHVSVAPGFLSAAVVKVW